MLFRRGKMLGMLGLLLALGLAAAACGGGGGGEPPASDGGGASGQVELTASSGFVFAPKEIRAKAGEPLTVVFKNTDSQLHDFVVNDIQVQIDGQERTGVEVAAEAGAEATITFTPTAAGEYEFYCSVPGHKTAGMVGTLIVE